MISWLLSGVPVLEDFAKSGTRRNGIGVLRQFLVLKVLLRLRRVVHLQPLKLALRERCKPRYKRGSRKLVALVSYPSTKICGLRNAC